MTLNASEFGMVGKSALDDSKSMSSIDSAAPDRDEQIIFTLRPTMIFVWMWYLLAAVVVIAVAALTGLLNGYWPETITTGVAFAVIAVVGLVVFLVPVYKHLLRRREVFTLTTDKLEVRFGILSKTTQNIPIRNIQEVTVLASAWQRLLRLGTIEIESASEAGRVTRLSEIPTPQRYADLILAQLRRRG